MGGGIYGGGAMGGGIWGGGTEHGPAEDADHYVCVACCLFCLFAREGRMDCVLQWGLASQPGAVR